MLEVDVPLSTSVTRILRRAVGETGWQPQLEAYRHGADRRLFGWNVAGEVVAVAGVSNERPDAELLHIATDPEHERKGNARSLVRALVDRFEYASLIAETDDDAVGFYQRLGFSVTPVDSPWPVARYRCVLTAL